MACCSADVMGDTRRLGAKAVELEASRDDGVVVRPDRTRLIVVGIEGGMIRRQGTDPPSRPHVRCPEALPYFLCPLCRHNAGPQTVPGIGCNCQDLFLGAIERISVEAELFVPKGLVESIEQGGCFFA